ncbi:hypothetical protein D3C80_1355760 [compost metagenome]
MTLPSCCCICACCSASARCLRIAATASSARTSVGGTPMSSKYCCIASSASSRSNGARLCVVVATWPAKPIARSILDTPIAFWAWARMLVNSTRRSMLASSFGGGGNNGAPGNRPIHRGTDCSSIKLKTMSTSGSSRSSVWRSSTGPSISSFSSLRVAIS